MAPGQDVTKPLDPRTTSFVDERPIPGSYYQVVAVFADGTEAASPAVALVSSTPMAATGKGAAARRGRTPGGGVARSAGSGFHCRGHAGGRRHPDCLRHAQRARGSGTDRCRGDRNPGERDRHLATGLRRRVIFRGPAGRRRHYGRKRPSPSARRPGRMWVSGRAADTPISSPRFTPTAGKDRPPRHSPRRPPSIRRSSKPDRRAPGKCS